MRHFYVLYTLIGLGFFGWTFTGCISIQNYYEQPSTAGKESISYVNHSGCTCSATADATHTHTAYCTVHSGELCERCREENSRTHSTETVYIITDRDGTRHYPHDYPADRREGGPHVIYLPDHQTTPPIVDRNPRYPERNQDQRPQDHVDGGLDGIVTVDREEEVSEENRGPYDRADGVSDGIVTGGDRNEHMSSPADRADIGVGPVVTAEKRTKTEDVQPPLKDRADQGQSPIVTENKRKKSEEGKPPLQDRFGGGIDGIVTVEEEEELTGTRKEDQEKHRSGTSQRETVQVKKNEEKKERIVVIPAEEKTGTSRSGNSGVITPEKKTSTAQRTFPTSPQQTRVADKEETSPPVTAEKSTSSSSSRLSERKEQASAETTSQPSQQQRLRGNQEKSKSTSRTISPTTAESVGGSTNGTVQSNEVKKEVKKQEKKKEEKADPVSTSSTRVEAPTSVSVQPTPSVEQAPQTTGQQVAAPAERVAQPANGGMIPAASAGGGMISP